MAVLIEQLSKFHFIVLHFPVALLSLLPVIVIAALFPFGKIWRPTIPYFVHFGTLFILPTVVFGQLLLVGRDTIAKELLLHQGLGYVTAGFMMLFSILLFFKKPDFEKEVPKFVIAMALLAALLVTITGHLGGESVHGSFFVLFGGE